MRVDQARLSNEDVSLIESVTDRLGNVLGGVTTFRHDSRVYQLLGNGELYSAGFIQNRYDELGIGDIVCSEGISEKEMATGTLTDDGGEKGFTILRNVLERLKVLQFVFIRDMMYIARPYGKLTDSQKRVLGSLINDGYLGNENEFIEDTLMGEWGFGGRKYGYRGPSLYEVELISDGAAGEVYGRMIDSFEITADEMRRYANWIEEGLDRYLELPKGGFTVSDYRRQRDFRDGRKRASEVVRLRQSKNFRVGRIEGIAGVRVVDRGFLKGISDLEYRLLLQDIQRLMVKSENVYRDFRSKELDTFKFSGDILDKKFEFEVKESTYLDALKKLMIQIGRFVRKEYIPYKKEF